MTRLLLGLLILACVAAPLVGQQQRPQANGMQQALAQKVAALGACNAELGPLQQLSARVLAGELVTMAQAVAQVRAEYEAANPGETFGTDFKKAAVPVKGEAVK